MGDSSRSAVSSQRGGGGSRGGPGGMVSAEWRRAISGWGLLRCSLPTALPPTPKDPALEFFKEL